MSSFLPEDNNRQLYIDNHTTDADMMSKIMYNIRIYTYCD